MLGHHGNMLEALGRMLYVPGPILEAPELRFGGPGGSFLAQSQRMIEINMQTQLASPKNYPGIEGLGMARYRDKYGSS